MIESPRHELDEAIDRVAAKMVEVPADDRLLSRTMAHLPERSATPWFLTMRAQLMAGAALAMVAFVFARPSREVTPRESLPVTEGVVVTGAQPLEAPHRLVAAPTPDPRSPIPDPRSPIPDPRSPIPDRPDHERSLAPVAALEAMAFESIAPVALEPEAAVVLAPLVLTELTLAGDFSARDR